MAIPEISINTIQGNPLITILGMVNQPELARVSKTFNDQTKAWVAERTNADPIHGCGYTKSKILRPFIPWTTLPTTHKKRIHFITQTIINVRKYCTFVLESAPQILSMRQPIETSVLENIITQTNIIKENRDLISFMFKVNSLQTEAHFQYSSENLRDPQKADEIRTFFQDHSMAFLALTHLNLSNCNLFSLPREIKLFTNLQELNLSTNYLTTLPSEIGDLRRLRKLHVENNQLINLPMEIENLTNLQDFCITTNCLTTFSPKIGRLTKLERLNIAHNYLIDLPHEIGRLCNLSELDISYNQLITFPSEIEQLEKIFVVRIDDCFKKTIQIESFHRAHPRCLVFFETTIF